MSALGLSVFSTRLLSAICGVLAIPIVFLIIKNLNVTKSRFAPLIGTLVFACNPWNVFFSRIGYEQNLALFLLCLSVLLILKSQQKPKLVILLLPLLSLATYADYPLRIAAPLTAIGALVIFRANLIVRKNYRYLFIGGVIAALLQIPNLWLISTPSFYTKGDHFYLDIITTQAQKIKMFLPEFPSVILAFIREFSSKYLTYFSPRSLFFLPDPDLQHSIPHLSVFYPWTTVPYLIGLYVAWKYRTGRGHQLILLLLLITPLSAALTRDPFHIQRALLLSLPLGLIIVVGIDFLIQKLPVRIWLPSLTVLMVSALVLLWRSYFILLPQLRADTWGSKFPILAKYIQNNPTETFIINQYETIKPQDVAYIQMAHYLKLPPGELQANQKAGIVPNYYFDTNFSLIHEFENMEFKPIDWGEAEHRNAVVVGDLTAISELEVKLHSLNQVLEIRDPNEQVVLRAFKTNPGK